MRQTDGETTEYLTDSNVQSETYIRRKCRPCLYFLYFFGYGVSLTLGVYIGYLYKSDHCLDDSSHSI